MTTASFRVLAALLLISCGSAESTDVPETVPVTTSAISTSSTSTTLSSDEPVAMVDGTAITLGQLRAISGDDLSQFDVQEAIRYLVYNHVLEIAAISLGIEVTDADVDDARERTAAEATEASGLTLQEVLDSAGVTAGLFEIIVQQRAHADFIELHLRETADLPSDTELQILFEELVGDRSTVCTSHILLDTESEAQRALDRALAGEDFVVLASELSTGPSAPDGGDLGCTSPTRFVSEFAEVTLAAELEVPYGPVESEFGWHVILVTERTIPTLDDLREELVGLTYADLLTDWILEQMSIAEISVEPQYGTWTMDPVPDVQPPE